MHVYLSPTIFPSESISILIAAGVLGRPGMSVRFPHIGITNPAPDDIQTSTTFNIQPLGEPFISGLSVRDACVFAIQTGKSLKPLASIF